MTGQSSGYGEEQGIGFRIYLTKYPTSKNEPQLIQD